MDNIDDDANTLKYTVHDYSSFSGAYRPENILADKPENTNSRWCSDSDEEHQFIMLKLERPAIVQKIIFGKYMKTHVCNVKKLLVYGGLVSEKLSLILDGFFEIKWALHTQAAFSKAYNPKLSVCGSFHSWDNLCGEFVHTIRYLESASYLGLKNDDVKEMFDVKHTLGGKYFPVQYIKIVPLQTWGAAFNYSIWYVALKGISDEGIVQKQLNWHATYKEKEVIRICLKHLRQHNYLQAYDSLAKETNVQLEHPFVTELYDTLVRKGNFKMCEEMISTAFSNGYLDDFIGSRNYIAEWTPLIQTDHPKPGMRGGHQMCLDPTQQLIYLFGGWNGSEDLNDLWSYHIPSNTWKCLSYDTLAEGGPCGRSCLKMCIDNSRQEIFMLGRYIDSTARRQPNLALKSDFYMYHIAQNKWTLICDDTATFGGPNLTFDHQMVMDVENRTIYTFGGRVLSSSGPDEARSGYQSSDVSFSGLYSYHVPTNTWKRLRKDSDVLKPGCVKSRVGHSMLFHPGTRQLFILGGQRHREYLSDFFSYDIDSDTIRMISDGDSGVPLGRFTHKSTIDSSKNEIYILAGLNKEKEKKEDNRNSLWSYDIKQGKWSKIVSKEPADKGDPLKEPCPRFAHQLVYDEATKIHYLFGGNPGRLTTPDMRLDDFWSLTLHKADVQSHVTNCLFLIRKLQYKELAQVDSYQAMVFMQNTLNPMVDHENSKQVAELQELASVLFTQHKHDPYSEPSVPPSGIDPYPTSSMSSSEIHLMKHHSRCALFNELMKYFPDEMVPPRGSLTDIVEC